jgi:hypothetical protein
MSKNLTFLKSNEKRFWERWIADPKFRELFQKNPQIALQKMDISFSEKFLKKILKEVKVTNIAEVYKKFNKIYFPLKIEKNYVLPSNPIFRSWYLYQFKELKRRGMIQTLFFPFAIELTKGCSSGCSFCGFSAQPLSGIYKYEPIFWKEVLLVLKKYCGFSFGKEGFCYWATDPYDNPEYEKFILDFFKVFKKFPCTTTAQFTKDVKRSKNLIRLINRNGGRGNLRGSILSFNSFNLLHENFSAEELKEFQVLFRFNNILPKIKSGRARKLKESKSLIKSSEEKNETIACVSGFLLNMVEKSVKLITPCKTDDDCPSGYRIISEKIFIDSEDLDLIIGQMIKVDMVKDMMRFLF